MGSDVPPAAALARILAFDLQSVAALEPQHVGGFAADVHAVFAACNGGDVDAAATRSPAVGRIERLLRRRAVLVPHRAPRAGETIEPGVEDGDVALDEPQFAETGQDDLLEPDPGGVDRGVLAALARLGEPDVCGVAEARGRPQG